MSEDTKHFILDAETGVFFSFQEAPLVPVKPEPKETE
jgi:hypothetical protein